MIEKAKTIVKDYIYSHTDHTNPNANPTIFVVWQVAVLQNFKCLIATTLPVGTYFELTYDGDEQCWYMDVYKKAENIEIPDEESTMVV